MQILDLLYKSHSNFIFVPNSNWVFFMISRHKKLKKTPKYILGLDLQQTAHLAY